MKGEKIIRLNSNTQLITRNNYSTNRVLENAPIKVTKRLELNINKLNRLATTIIAPDLVDAFEEDDLSSILDFSNSANNDIGLPVTNSLIIRTAGRSEKKTEPSLLVENIHGETHYTYTGVDGNRKLEGVREFTRKMLQAGTYLIIHDDNYELQKRGRHSRTLETSMGAELLFGTDVLHTRFLENEDKPAVRINLKDNNVISHFKFRKLFSFDICELGEIAESPLGYLKKNDIGIRVKNMSKNEAIRIGREIQKTEEAMTGAHEAGQELRGNDVVVESRIYTSLQGGIGKRLQVIDID